MKRPKIAVGYAVLLALLYVLYFWGLGDLPFYNQGEPREAVQVWEAIERGEWILQLQNGTVLPYKPPFFHYLGTLSALATGRIDEYSTRLPSAVVAALTVLAIAWYGTRKWGAAAGLFAAFILATNLEWIRTARAARVDMVLTGLLTSAFLSIDAIVIAPSPPALALALFYTSMGLATLTKGPVGMALPLLVLLACLACRRDLGRLRAMHPFLGGAVAVLIPGWWYVAASFAGGEAFVRKHLMAENLLRYFGTAAAPVVGQDHPFYYYFTHLFGTFAPWSIFLIPFGVHLFLIRRRPEARDYTFPLIWFATVLLFYSAAAGKRLIYIISAYPAAALMLGIWWSRLGRKEEAPVTVRWLLATVVGAGVVVLPLLGLIVVGQAVGVDPLEWIRPVLHHKDQHNLPLVQEAIRAHSAALIVFLLCIGVPLGMGARRRSAPLIFGSVVLLVAGIALGINAVFHPLLARDRTFKPFIEEVLATVGENDEIAYYKTFDDGAIFYLRRHAPILGGDLPEPGDRPLYLVLWESEWEKLQPRERQWAQLLKRSEGTGPTGKDRLVLAVIAAKPASTSVPPRGG